jgi:hypothetical protein
VNGTKIAFEKEMLASPVLKLESRYLQAMPGW